MHTQEKSRTQHNTSYCAIGCLLLLGVITFIISNETIYSSLVFLGSEANSIVSGLFSMIYSGISHTFNTLFSIMIYAFSPIFYFLLILSAKSYGFSNIVLFAGAYCACRSLYNQNKVRNEAVKSSAYGEFIKSLGLSDDLYFKTMLTPNIKSVLIANTISMIIFSVMVISFLSLKNINPSISYDTFTVHGASYNILLMMSEMLNIDISVKEAYSSLASIIIITFGTFFILLASLNTILRKNDNNYIIQIEGKSKLEIEEQIDKYRGL